MVGIKRRKTHVIGQTQIDIRNLTKEGMEHPQILELEEIKDDQASDTDLTPIEF